MLLTKLIAGIMIAATVVTVALLWYRETQQTTQHAFDAEAGTAQYVYDVDSINALLRTEGVQHTIPLEDIVSGGVPKDAIMSMESTAITTVAQIPAWFDRTGMGITVSVGEAIRFYPYQVLAHHEIANDVMHGTPVMITYCPLCFTGVVYDPRIDGEVVHFGVSGKLWQSNLIMYNRSHPESLWSQATGEAIVGAHVGQTLAYLPFEIMSFDVFARDYPTGEVVIGDADNPRAYENIPYGGDLSNPNVRFPTRGDQDERFASNEVVLGVRINGQEKAYSLTSIKEAQPFLDEVGGHTLEVSYNHDKEIMVVYDITDGVRKRVQPVPHFWFAWVAMHPETELYL